MRAASLRILGAIVIVLSLALTGCAGLVEKVIKDQTGVDINTDDGTVQIDTEDGTVQLGTAEFPSDFPAGIPVPNGTLVGTLVAENSWGLTYQDVGEAEVERLTAALEAAGFTKKAEISQADVVQTGYQNDEWTVSVIWTSGSGDATDLLVYAVAEAS